MVWTQRRQPVTIGDRGGIGSRRIDSPRAINLDEAEAGRFLSPIRTLSGGHHDQGHVGGLQHVPHAFGRCSRVDRHILSTRGHDCVNRNQHLHRAFDAHRHCDIRRDPMRNQFASQSCHSRREFFVRDVPGTERQRSLTRVGGNPDEICHSSTVLCRRFG